MCLVSNFVIGGGGLQPGSPMPAWVHPWLVHLRDHHMVLSCMMIRDLWWSLWKAQFHMNFQLSQQYLCFYIPYACIDEYLHLHSKPAKAQWWNMVHHILTFAYIFWSLLQPSSQCFMRILITYNNCPNCISKTIVVTVSISKLYDQRESFPHLLPAFHLVYILPGLVKTSLPVLGNYLVTFVSVHAMYSSRQYSDISFHTTLLNSQKKSCWTEVQ